MPEQREGRVGATLDGSVGAERGRSRAGAERGRSRAGAERAVGERSPRRAPPVQVYDVTEYIDDHPGGMSICNNAGADATEVRMGVAWQGRRPLPDTCCPKRPVHPPPLAHHCRASTGRSTPTPCLRCCAPTM